MTWFPVWLETEAPADGVECDAARGALVAVCESEPASVGSLTLVAEEQSVLVLEGELLVGGMQDRVLASSVLLAAGQPTQVPVRCVEAQRWHGGSTISRSGRLVPPSVRAAAVTGSAATRQTRVWDAVAERRRARGLGNPAASVGEALEAAAGLPAGGPQLGQRGVVSGVDGRIVALEAFTSEAHYAAWHSAIVVAVAAESQTGAAVACSARSARRFARRVAALQGVREPAPGLGGRVTAAAEGVVATGACDADGVAVHVLALAA